jgi:hypothetical protein
MDEMPEGPNIESPLEAYTRLLKQNREMLAFQQRRDKYLGYAKVGLAFLAAFFLVRYVHELHGFWLLLVTLGAFVILALVHEQILARVREINTVITFYERGLERLEIRWAGTGESGERFFDPTHPYARDLDIFGKGSIFELLCTVRTRAGEDTLARWLLKPAPPDEFHARQIAIQDLKTRTEFRERLFAKGSKVRLSLHPDVLTAWGEHALSFGAG